MTSRCHRTQSWAISGVNCEVNCRCRRDDTTWRPQRNATVLSGARINQNRGANKGNKGKRGGAVYGGALAEKEGGPFYEREFLRGLRPGSLTSWTPGTKTISRDCHREIASPPSLNDRSAVRGATPKMRPCPSCDLLTLNKISSPKKTIDNLS